ncbi:MAG: ATP-dependent DNA helicase RecG [Cytophagales bacterium]|nr:ATP-dependent DNA helicase RecG [Cytophagales bacterium]
MHAVLDAKIEYLEGFGPRKVSLLNKELGIFTYSELLQYFPFRHEDRTQFHQISQLHAGMPYIQLKGKFRRLEVVGEDKKQRLVGQFEDGTGTIELVWFKGVKWMKQRLAQGPAYVVFGKPSVFNGKFSISHPEIDEADAKKEGAPSLQPVYQTTERMKNGYLDSKALSKAMHRVLKKTLPHIPENLPDFIRERYKLIGRREAFYQIHFPKSLEWLQAAKTRLKFEELFFIQLKLIQNKICRQEAHPGIVCSRTELLTEFYNRHLPFDLTGAQKKVIREVYDDMRRGKQMNRLVQGDVGSGKTIVAFICMLLAVNAGKQAALMAPTEILAIQHLKGLEEFTGKMNLSMALLTGSTRKKAREKIHQDLQSGELDILVGTHALLEDTVQFQSLGLAVIDEQHRFGVAQRARLWTKNRDFYPHMLVMTATPIPRTLAMTLYGDLDVSVIDELPAGRKPIQTSHLYDAHRLKINSFVRREIEKGRQVYIVYPLIDENEKLGLKDLMDGYESACRAFPEYPISIVHGKMKPEAKDYEMMRFAKGETKIMVATTVIEVGVNVPNASVMIIENAERFGLAQLHQLRGRVGRGSEQSYCLLVTSDKLSKEGKIRMETMVRTNNGFEIADTDLKLRGPGDVSGTRQSGVLDLKVADLAQDQEILKSARTLAGNILKKDPTLSHEVLLPVRQFMQKDKKSGLQWGNIS